ncbi:hypothetical protein ACYTKI_001369 [Escherichia albertii]|uniref:hypothetical protein n=1 Tax=Escherichia albertii TaxID=208962 RepID=UPI001F3AD1F5|nr:hypothetical protein [Escherichia albertii]WDB40579.1 hypothetical protein PS052_09365 [Escherichia albertii]WKU82583.1 hypothetical protein MJ90_10125 [Escherichia albertii]
MSTQKMNREKTEALMSVILKEADPKKFPEKLSEDAIVSFYRANSSYLNCSTLREWLSGEAEPSDEILQEIMVQNNWRATKWSNQLP